jgi:hypothetical protein
MKTQKQRHWTTERKETKEKEEAPKPFDFVPINENQRIDVKSEASDIQVTFSSHGKIP